MLTPVEEWPADEEGGNGLSQGEDDSYIISSASVKLDSEEGVTPGDMESEEGSVRELDPEESGISILSGEFDTPPRLLGLSRSMEDIIDASFGTTRRFEEDITKLIQSQSSNDTQDSSQGSDDSSPFSSENVQALLDRSDPQTSPRGTLSLPSSVEGTPVRSLAEGRRPNSSNGHLFADLSPQHFHPTRTHLNTQSDNVSTKPNPPVNGHTSMLNLDNRSNPRSFSGTGIVNTYSRYNETTRTVDPLENRAEGDIEGKSQDSNGTLTEGDSTSESTTNENIESHHEMEHVGFEKSKCANDDVLGLRQLKDAHKHIDSGIEEVGTPDAGRTDDYVGISGTNEEEDVPLPDDSKTSKSLSYATLFTSCESGLDSPDPESIIEEHAKRPPSEDHHLKKDPRVEIFTTRMHGTSPKPIVRLHQTSYSQTSLSSDGSSDLGPSVAEILEDHRNTCGTECAAPRSLEGPSFSRYARVPIRHCESKHALLSKSADTGDRLRYRASSLDEASSDGDSHVRLERQSSSESTTSESNLDLGFRVAHQPAGVFQVEQRFKRRSLSESGLNTVQPRSWKTNSPLHVLRIIPNARTTPPPAERNDPTTPDGTRSSSSPEVQTLQLRMMSPETPQQPRLVKMPLVHSKSDEFDNSGVMLTKVGSLYVIPEVKPRSVSIGSDGKAAEDSLGRPARPTADVTDIEHSNRVSVESFGSTGSSDSNPRSPKNTKRGRTPQFV